MDECTTCVSTISVAQVSLFAFTLICSVAFCTLRFIFYKNSFFQDSHGFADRLCLLVLLVRNLLLTSFDSCENQYFQQGLRCMQFDQGKILRHSNQSELHLSPEVAIMCSRPLSSTVHRRSSLAYLLTFVCHNLELSVQNDCQHHLGYTKLQYARARFLDSLVGCHLCEVACFIFPQRVDGSRAL